MDSKKWADDLIHHMRRVSAEAQSVSISQASTGQPVSAAGISSSRLDGAAIAAALAEYCRNNNSTTQALAIRLASLAARYPQRAA